MCRVEYMVHACLVKFKLSCTIAKIILWNVGILSLLLYVYVVSRYSEYVAMYVCQYVVVVDILECICIWELQIDEGLT